MRIEDDILDFEGAYDQNSRLVIIQAYGTDSEARIAAARLREAGISCTISHSLVNAMLPLIGESIRLYVKEDDVQRASYIVAKLNRTEESVVSYHDADHDDIEYLKAVHTTPGVNKYALWLFWILAALLVLRALLRASGIMQGWYDPF